MENIEPWSLESMEKCILCHKDTPYRKDTHIDLRSLYIEGAGQLCYECDKEHG